MFLNKNKNKYLKIYDIYYQSHIFKTQFQCKYVKLCYEDMILV